MCTDLLTMAFRGIYPFQSEDIYTFMLYGKDKKFDSSQEIVEIVSHFITELEGKLNNYEKIKA